MVPAYPAGISRSVDNPHVEPEEHLLVSTDPKSSYYDVGGIETIDIIRAKLTPEQYRGYLMGCLIKYLGRMNHKGQASRDAEKVSIYAALLREAHAPHSTGSRATWYEAAVDVDES